MSNDPNFLPENQITEPTRKRSVFFIILLCIFFFFGGCLITRAILAEDPPEDPLAYDPITLEPKKPQGFLKKIKNLVAPPREVLSGEENHRINILLLGQGGPGHDGPYLTDTIIIASVNTQTKQVAFTSVPRDLVIKIPGQGYKKINHANSIGEVKQKGLGPAFATNVIQNTFDMEIPYYMLVDFKAFEEIIDAVGGTEINVERSFTDAEYPIPGRENALPESSRYKVVRFSAGVQTMNGKTALEFSRSRHGNNGEGSDFARSKRQQKVILALKEKILSAETFLNPIRLNEIFNSLQNHITTNLQFSDLVAFLKLAREFDTQHIFSLSLDDSPTGFLKNGYSGEGAFILEPRTGDFVEIQEAIENIFTGTSTMSGITVPKTPSPRVTINLENTTNTMPAKPAVMKIEVKNGTWREGLAARVKSQLEEKNLFVPFVSNTALRPQAKSGVYILTETPNTDTVEVLKNELKIPLLSSPSGEKNATGTDILVILGEDYSETP